MAEVFKYVYFFAFQFFDVADCQLLAEDTVMANTEDGKPDVAVNHDKRDVGREDYL